LAKKAEKILGQPIIVLNKPGASGTLGVGAVAAAKPDGYTIGTLTFAALTMVPHGFNVPYNPLTDFDYILGYGQYLFGPCVRADSSFKTLKDLVQFAKPNPGKIKYSSTSLSSTNHFTMAHLAKAEGIKWDVVVFKDTPATVAACLGGHVDIVSQNPGDVVPYIVSGRLRLLFSASSTRWKWVPDVPTAKELGYNFEIDSWLSLGAPKGVPKPIIGKLRDAFKKALDDRDLLEIMEKIYLPVVYRTPEEYQKLVEKDYKENEAMFLELGLHKSQKK
jgi:tripartite-type tricarboxylate transporter receptor subunit TctC